MRVCKVTPPVFACRMCFDTWESMSGNVEQMPNCKTCTYNTQEYEIVEFIQSCFGSYAVLNVGGKLEKVSLDRIRDYREV